MDTNTLNPLSALDALAGLDANTDLLGGTNLRVVAGETQTFPFGSRTGYISVPEGSPRLMSLVIADQNGMTVIRGQIAIRGERIGILGEEDNPVPLPTYTIPLLSTWRGWTHFVNFEFMRPNDTAVEILRELALAAGFVEREERQVELADGEEPQEPKQIKSFDRQAPGNRLQDRYDNSILLDSFVLVPDLRVAPLVTEYVNSEQQTVQKAAFTGFIDVQNAVAEQLAKAVAANDREAAQSAARQLSHLTGINPDSDYPFRPTIGYITPTGQDEIIVFPDREESSEETPTTTETPTEGAQVVDVTEAPFSG